MRFSENIRVCHSCVYGHASSPSRQGLYSCLADPKGRTTQEVASEHSCPKNKFPILPSITDNCTQTHWGRTMWAEFHAMKPDPVKLTEFSKRVPCEECQIEWNKLLETSPPDFSSPEAWDKWKIAIHDNVNQRLGKPIWANRSMNDTIKKTTTAVDIKPCGGCNDRVNSLDKTVPYTSTLSWRNFLHGGGG